MTFDQQFKQAGFVGIQFVIGVLRWPDVAK